MHLCLERERWNALYKGGVCACAHLWASYPHMASRRCWWNMLRFCSYVLNPELACASFLAPNKILKLKGCGVVYARGVTALIPKCIPIPFHLWKLRSLQALLPTVWPFKALYEGRMPRTREVYLNAYLLSRVLFINSLNELCKIEGCLGAQAVARSQKNLEIDKLTLDSPRTEHELQLMPLG